MIDHFFPEKRIIMILGVLQDKDYRQMMQQLPRRLARILTVPPSSERALPAAELAQAIERTTAEPYGSVSEALSSARQDAGDEELIDRTVTCSTTTN